MSAFAALPFPSHFANRALADRVYAFELSRKTCCSQMADTTNGLEIKVCADDG